MRRFLLTFQYEPTARSAAQQLQAAVIVQSECSDTPEQVAGGATPCHVSEGSTAKQTALP